MITFEFRQDRHLPIELEIMNSNPEFNQISNGKTHLNQEDLDKERQEGKAVHAKRYVIKEHEQYIGIIEYCPLNPNDGKPWIGLFVMHKDFQGKGLAKLAYKNAEAHLAAEGFKEIRLGVLTNNDRGIRFWERMGYTAFKEGMHENKPIFHYQKRIKESDNI